jgi:hypothetical protein
MRIKMTTGLEALALTAAAVVALVLPGVTASAGPAATPIGARSTAASCAINWGSLPKEDQAPAGGAILTNVRSGRHDCFDRLVLDGSSFVRARYVDQVRADGSGAVVPLRGGARLQIITSSAGGAVTADPPYQPADPRELVDLTGYRTFRQAAWAGDFEGQSTIGLGVRAQLPFRVFVLTAADGSSRAVIDVAHQW